MYDLISRTTAALEAYNRHLGNKIRSHADFFALCKGLLEEDSNKSRDFGIIARGGKLQNQRREYRLRDETIRKLNQQLMDDEITSDQFLNSVVFSGVCKDRCNFDENQSDSDSDSESVGLDVPSVESNEPSQPAVIQTSTCAVCYENNSDVLLNCGHYKYCITCFEIEDAMYKEKKLQFVAGNLDNEPQFKCPICKANITNYLHLPRIYN